MIIKKNGNQTGADSRYRRNKCSKKEKKIYFSLFDIRELRHLILSVLNYFCQNMHPVTLYSCCDKLKSDIKPISYDIY